MASRPGGRDEKALIRAKPVVTGFVTTPRASAVPASPASPSPPSPSSGGCRQAAPRRTQDRATESRSQPIEPKQPLKSPVPAASTAKKSPMPAGRDVTPARTARHAPEPQAAPRASRPSPETPRVDGGESTPLPTPQTPRTPASASETEISSVSLTPCHSQPASALAASAASSPRARYDRDRALFARLYGDGLLSDGIQRWLSLYLRVCEAALSIRPLSEVDHEILYMAGEGLIKPAPLYEGLRSPSKQTPRRRLSSEDDSEVELTTRRVRWRECEESPTFASKQDASTTEKESPHSPAGGMVVDGTSSAAPSAAPRNAAPDVHMPRPKTASGAAVPAQKTARKPTFSSVTRAGKAALWSTGVGAASRYKAAAAKVASQAARVAPEMPPPRPVTRPPPQPVMMDTQVEAQQRPAGGSQSKKTPIATEEARSQAAAPAPAPASTKKTEKYPPLIVERLPEWPRHFKEIAQRLGRPPNARPFGNGVRFSPESADEYRLLQRYLTVLEKTENVPWFCYSLPAERSLKVAIRGLPVDTPPADLLAALEEKGFLPEFAKNIRARGGRPGSIFHVVLKRTQGLTPAVYELDELMNMRGIKVEAWRGKTGPAQCHRCQEFRHSSKECHKPLACVRCGGSHTARDCERPRKEPPTCANCGGPHPANYTQCPVFRREARNKRAGTVARSGQVPVRQRNGQSLPPQMIVEEAAPGSLMAPANDPTTRGGSGPGSRRRRKNRRAATDSRATTSGEVTNAPPAPQTSPQPAEQLEVMARTIEALQEIMQAVREGENGHKAALKGLRKLFP